MTDKDEYLVKRGRAARTKGAAGEREVCEILTRLTGKAHKRNLGQARDSGCDVNYGPFLLEVKRQERLKMPEWQQQAAVAAEKEGLVPAVVYRQNGGKFWISCPFETFVALFEAMLKGEHLDGPAPHHQGQDDAA